MTAAMLSLLQRWMPSLVSCASRRRRAARIPTERQLLRLLCICQKGLWRVWNVGAALQSAQAWSHLTGRDFHGCCSESKIICCSVLFCLLKMCVFPSVWVILSSTHTDVSFLVYHWRWHRSRCTPLMPVYVTFKLSRCYCLKWGHFTTY